MIIDDNEGHCSRGGGGSDENNSDNDHHSIQIADLEHGGQAVVRDAG